MFVIRLHYSNSSLKVFLLWMTWCLSFYITLSIVHLTVPIYTPEHAVASLRLHCHTKRSFKNYMTPDARHGPFQCRSRLTNRNLLRLVTRLFAALNDDKRHGCASKDVSGHCHHDGQHRHPPSTSPSVPGLGRLVLSNSRNEESLSLGDAVIVL